MSYLKKCLTYFSCFILSIPCFGGSVSVTLENDITSSTDDSYTHGTQFSYAFGDSKIKLKQTIYTPDDLRESEYIPDDRPYAGLLMLSYGTSETADRDYYYIEFGAGFLGEYSFADEVQTWVHEKLDNTIPQGWDNQIDKGFVFTINSTYKHKLLDYEYFELIPYSGIEVGTVWDYFRIGMEPKIGFNIPDDFDDHIIQPTTLSLSDLSFYLYGISEVRYVLYNATLKGVDAEDFVFDYGAGFKLVYGNFGLNLTHIWRSKEFSEGDEQNYSSLTLEYKL